VAHPSRIGDRTQRLPILATSESSPPGRGTTLNPTNRFEQLAVAPDESVEPESGRPETVFLRDHSRSVLAHNTSSDVPFDVSINPYRGCEHGCVYCYARPTHELLGFSAGLDFETRILVKEDAPELLRRELASPRWQPQVVAFSGNTDCYQPAERRLQITRRCLAVFAEARNPVQLITKNHLVTRDLDLLAELARFGAVHVMVSITTLDRELARRLEPRTSQPRYRLDALRALRAAGVPCGVLVAPVIPALNDVEIPAILEAAAEAGASNAGFVVLRLPHGVKELFEDWLERHLPERRGKVLHRVRELRGGELNDHRFGSRMRGSGVYAEQIRGLFELHRKRLGLAARGGALSTASFRAPTLPGQQIGLFE
jgi:DNA repair photolyase